MLSNDMKLRTFLEILAIAVTLVGCTQKETSDDLPIVGDSVLELNKTELLFDGLGGEDRVFSKDGEKMYFETVLSQIGDQEKVEHPLGEGVPPFYTSYSVIDGGWFRLEKLDDGKVLRCETLKNEDGVTRKIYIYISDGTDAHGYFEVTQSAVE